MNLFEEFTNVFSDLYKYRENPLIGKEDYLMIVLNVLSRDYLILDSIQKNIEFVKLLNLKEIVHNVPNKRLSYKLETYLIHEKQTVERAVYDIFENCYVFRFKDIEDQLLSLTAFNLIDELSYEQLNNGFFPEINRTQLKKIFFDCEIDSDKITISSFNSDNIDTTIQFLFSDLIKLNDFKEKNSDLLNRRIDELFNFGERTSEDLIHCNISSGFKKLRTISDIDNVLKNDMHVEFERRLYISIQHDELLDKIHEKLFTF